MVILRDGMASGMAVFFRPMYAAEHSARFPPCCSVVSLVYGGSLNLKLLNFSIGTPPLLASGNLNEKICWP